MTAALRKRLSKIRERAASLPPRVTVWLPDNGRGDCKPPADGSVVIYQREHHSAAVERGSTAADR